MQYAAAIIATIAIPSGNVYSSWASPGLIKLNSTDSPLDRPITTEEGSWIASVHALAIIPAGLISVLIIHRVPRKYLLLCTSVCLFFPWFLCIFASSVAMIISAKLLGGIGSGITDIVVPIYVSEIAEKDIRGQLGAFYNVLKLTGTLIVYSAGPFVSFTTLGIICSIFPVVFFVLFCFMPESPYYLVRKGKLAEAEKSLSILSINSDSSKQSMEIVVNTVNFDMQNKGSFFSLLLEKKCRKSLLIMLCLKTFQQLSGINAINAYSQTIISLSGSSISPEISSVIFGAVQIPTVLVVASVVDKVGRKPLCIISCIGCSLALITEGIYFYLHDVLHKNLDIVSWLPTVALLVYLILSPLGLLTLTYVIMGELFSTNFKEKAATVSIVYGGVLSFTVIKTFKPLSETWGMHVMFWIFGVITFFGAVVIYIVLPETKGKSFLEIQEKINGKRK